MRCLHTADWHVGRTIRNRSRVDEHRAIFAEMLEIAEADNIEAFLVAGDIFHERKPPPEAIQLVTELWAELSARGIPVIAIPGNHDDPALLASLAPLAARANIHIVTEPHALRLGDLGVACVPYIHPHRVTNIAEMAAQEDRQAQYESFMLNAYRQVAAHIRDASARVLLTHPHIAASEPGGGEWHSTVLPISAALFPSGLDYVACGHIHKAQSVRAKSPLWYAGSPLQMDFGERLQDKGVNIISIENRETKIERVLLNGGKQCMRRVGTAADILTAAPFLHEWTECVVSIESRPEDIDTLRALSSVVAVRLESRLASEKTITGISQPGPTPLDLLQGFLDRKGRTLTPEMAMMFERLYAEAQQPEQL
jgi:exonuclease SbcD